jgi:hypothetical protein
VLMESPDVGRTEQFTPVRVATTRQSGVTVDVTITGHDGRQLRSSVRARESGDPALNKNPDSRFGGHEARIEPR